MALVGVRLTAQLGDADRSGQDARVVAVNVELIKRVAM